MRSEFQKQLELVHRLGIRAAQQIEINLAVEAVINFFTMWTISDSWYQTRAIAASSYQARAIAASSYQAKTIAASSYQARAIAARSYQTRAIAGNSYQARAIIEQLKKAIEKYHPRAWRHVTEIQGNCAIGLELILRSKTKSLFLGWNRRIGTSSWAAGQACRYPVAVTLILSDIQYKKTLQSKPAIIRTRAIFYCSSCRWSSGSDLQRQSDIATRFWKQGTLLLIGSLKAIVGDPRKDFFGQNPENRHFW